MTASSLVESGQPQAEVIIDTSDEDRIVSGDTERILPPDLDEIVERIFSRNQNLTREAQFDSLSGATDHNNLYGQPLSSS